jgi:hypothetical protein
MRRGGTTPLRVYFAEFEALKAKDSLRTEEAVAWFRDLPPYVQRRIAHEYLLPDIMQARR